MAGQRLGRPDDRQGFQIDRRRPRALFVDGKAVIVQSGLVASEAGIARVFLAAQEARIHGRGRLLDRAHVVEELPPGAVALWIFELDLTNFTV